MTAGRITIVGLGPAGTDHLLPAARVAFEEGSPRFVRTARHPACDELAAAGVEFSSFDAHYDAAENLDANYRGIVAELVARAAEHGDVVYGVPGNPSVAERTVTLLHEAAARGEVSLRVLPGLSFADLAWARLGVDPMDGEARVVDGRAIESAELAGPLLIAQCDNDFVVSDVKLALLEHLDAATPVTVLQRLGLPDEHVSLVPLEELDRGAFTPDHLTSLFVDAGAAGAARELVNLFQLARRLRGPGGCPWDAEQTHHSLTRYLLEEAYEVVEALEALPADGPVPPELYAAVEDELGDLLFQVVFHALIAQESGAFGMADVARGIHDKLVRRHPHVFGDVVAEQSDDVLRNWEQIKKGEKGTTSLVEGITPGLPSLLYTHKLFRKAATVQMDPGGVDDALARIDAAVATMRADDADVEAALAEVLVGAVIAARAGGIDAESALRAWAANYRDRFQRMEHLADEQGVDLATASADTVQQLWESAATA
ncbi:MAG: nucleoside triphosphate pyrophosphohydrolase [Acidimicrobiia bacterium]